jgi:hypothetical protein
LCNDFEAPSPLTTNSRYIAAPALHSPATGITTDLRSCKLCGL